MTRYDLRVVGARSCECGRRVRIRHPKRVYEGSPRARPPAMADLGGRAVASVPTVANVEGKMGEGRRPSILSAVRGPGERALTEDSR